MLSSKRYRKQLFYTSLFTVNGRREEKQQAKQCVPYKKAHL